MVKASWYQSRLLGWLMRSTQYVPGPGMPGDEDRDMPESSTAWSTSSGAAGRCSSSRRARARRCGLLRMSREAFEADMRTSLPLVRLFT